MCGEPIMEARVRIEQPQGRRLATAIGALMPFAWRNSAQQMSAILGVRWTPYWHLTIATSAIKATMT